MVNGLWRICSEFYLLECKIWKIFFWSRPICSLQFMVMSSPQKTGIELRWHDMKIFGFNSGKKLENCLVNLRSCCISLFRRFESDTFVYDIVFNINRFHIQGFGLNDLLEKSRLSVQQTTKLHPQTMSIYVWSPNFKKVI